MRLLHGLARLLLFGSKLSGFAYLALLVTGQATTGIIQDSREEFKDKKIEHLEKHVKSLQKESISYRKLKSMQIHDTLIKIPDTIRLEHERKLVIHDSITKQLTGQESTRVWRSIEDKKYDSILKSRQFKIGVKKGTDNGK